MVFVQRDRPAVHADVVALRIDPHAERLNNLAINLDATGHDHFFGVPPGGEPGAREHLLQTLPVIVPWRRR